LQSRRLYGLASLPPRAPSKPAGVREEEERPEMKKNGRERNLSVESERTLECVIVFLFL